MNINIQFDESTKMGDIRRIAKEIKINHELAEHLWETNKYHERLLSILIMNKKLLTEEYVDYLVQTMGKHPHDEQIQLMDWLFTNQLAKFKQGLIWIQSWEKSQFALQRRTYWYYQARLRWMGKEKAENSEQLLIAIENNILDEDPEVQWAMNFVAGWIGVYEDEYQERCVQLGQRTGLYKNDKVHKGCTPNYLPGFIKMEREKRGKQI